MIKDVIVSLSVGDGVTDKAGPYAVSVAEAFEAHVLGVGVVYDPVIPGAVLGGIPPEFIDSQRREADGFARTSLAQFEQAAKRAGVSYETLTASDSIGGAADRMTRLARRFDLAVIGQAEPDRTAIEETIAEGVLFGAGRPVIVVPFIQKKGLDLDHVMVCWDGGQAAARAIGDAMPFLKKARQVEVVIVGNDPGKKDEMPGADLGKHLARQGLKVDVKRLTAPDLDVTNTLLSYAADSGATFMVMGGYGHSRLREFVLGGATRGMLSSMTVPTLMSH
jgi:nucleotide-binding universal stress UspA family protein